MEAFIIGNSNHRPFFLVEIILAKPNIGEIVKRLYPHYPIAVLYILLLVLLIATVMPHILCYILLWYKARKN